jgi:hypothetical protein
MQYPPQRQRTRGGCLGGLVKVILALAFGLLVIYGVRAVFTPWGFYLGGNFHILPYWQGWGRLHSEVAGEYAIYVQMEPTSGGRYNSFLNGNGYVCTPRGEKIRLSLSGTMRKGLNLSTDGEKINITIHNDTVLAKFNGDRRPDLELHGQWQNPNLVANDNGSIDRAFQPDGSVYLGHDPNRPYKLEVLPITLKPGSYSEFESACKEIATKTPSH